MRKHIAHHHVNCWRWWLMCNASLVGVSVAKSSRTSIWPSNPDKASLFCESFNCFSTQYEAILALSFQQFWLCSSIHGIDRFIRVLKTGNKNGVTLERGAIIRQHCDNQATCCDSFWSDWRLWSCIIRCNSILPMGAVRSGRHCIFAGWQWHSDSVLRPQRPDHPSIDSDSMHHGLVVKTVCVPVYSNIQRVSRQPTGQHAIVSEGCTHLVHSSNYMDICHWPTDLDCHASGHGIDVTLDCLGSPGRIGVHCRLVVRSHCRRAESKVYQATKTVRKLNQRYEHSDDRKVLPVGAVQTVQVPQLLWRMVDVDIIECCCFSNNDTLVENVITDSSMLSTSAIPQGINSACTGENETSIKCGGVWTMEPNAFILSTL